MKNHFLFLITILVTLNLGAQEQVFDWAKSVGGNGLEVGNSITTDSFGNVFVCGTFTGTVDFDPGVGVFNLTSNGASDFFIQKLDSLGDFVWAKSIGGTHDDEANSLVYDGFNSLIITGKFIGTVDFDPNSSVFTLFTGGTYILKLNLNGNFEWAKSFSGTGSDEGNAVTVDGVGNVYVTGEFSGTADFNPGPGVFNMVSVGFTPDVYVLKLNSNGIFSWAVSMGSSSNDAGWGIGIDSANNVYVTGIFFGVVDFDPSPSVYNLTSLNSTWDMFVFKLDHQANFIWAKSVGGFESIWPRGFEVDNSGNVIITGSFRLTVDFDPGISVSNLTSSAYGDVFVEKLSTDGDFIWARSFGGYSWDEGRSIAIDTLNNIYLTGVYYGTVDFDPSNDTKYLTAVDLGDIFIEKLDSLGNFIWVKSCGGVGEDFGYAVSINSSSDLLVTGAFNNTVDFDPGSTLFNLTSNGGFDLFIQKFSVNGLADTTIIIGVESLSNSKVTIYPNPTVSHLYIKNLNEIHKYEIGIYSLDGRVIQFYKGLESNSIDVSALEPGVYFLSLKSEKENLVKRFVIIN